jgi:AcrR family transcriptional regulator
MAGARSVAKKATPRGGSDGQWNPPQALREHRREVILRSVAKFLRNAQLSSVTMEDIATELGMTKGNLYYYFKDKQDILFQCHMRSVDICLMVLEEAVAASDSPREKLRNLLVNHILGILNDGFGGVMQTDLEHFLPEQRSQYVKRRDLFEHGVRALIDDGIRAGEFKKLNVKLAGFSILGSINWIPKWYRPSGLLSPAEIAEQMSDYFLDGLAPAASSDARR